MKGMDIWFWISHNLKNIAFHPVTGFEKIAVDTYSEIFQCEAYGQPYHRCILQAKHP